MDEVLLAAHRLARQGLMGGNPEAVLGMPADLAMDQLHLMAFDADYNAAYAEMNKEDKN